ncbi:ABC-type branched-subunit amino acid transport system permease subunit [Methylorubrum rhodinum]|uniref:ABC-type branched-subunit amino acid transport system permease subunit n=1 Tax=Methylorubrum rhodinum TaxID=29428 RepID=A0A840ZH77_9HYPH|nr:branched-chain amino acid ABC transporter permease [Methylorubrum rhodinum]MBB5756505.1 ABC-type branched-subunit amino acid transport system permease subunit [Methylorubrum rhodinum]
MNLGPIELTAAPVPAGGFSERAIAVAVPVLAFVGLGWLLAAEHEWEIVAILVGFLAALLLFDRTRAGRAATAACRGQRGVTNASAALAVLALLWAFREEHYALLMVATVALSATACIGLNVQMAFGGIANFAAAAFFTLGAYTAAVLAGHTALPHLLVLAAGGLVTAALGLLLLLPVLRTRGHYVALVTIAFGVMLRSLLEVNDTLGGPQGMKIPGFAPFGLDFGTVSSIAGHEVSFYLPYALAAAVLFALAFAAMRCLELSWAGIAIDAVRTDPIAASTFGLSPARWKATAFLFGNAMIGVAGALYGMMNGFVNPNGAGFGESLMLLSIVVLGGLGNVWGTVAASAVILALPEKLQPIQEYRLLIFAAVVIAILRFRPGGLLPRPLRILGNRNGG